MLRLNAIAAGLVVLACLLAAPAQAVVVASVNSTATLNAPSANPYWDNVGQMSGASAVYLGNGWAITANHVTDADMRLTDGRDFAVATGSQVVVSNPAGGDASGNADLRLFRLAGDPGLPALTIGSTAPATSALVMMIGAGRDRSDQQIGWSVSSTFAWTPTLPPLANVRGFSLLSTSHMRWGEARISGTPTVNNNTSSLVTNFSQSGGPFEAQAVVGDSGGGVFQQVHGAWQLAGIIDAQQLMTNQPSDTVVFGDASFLANLAAYHDEILKIIDAPVPAWRNANNYFDVDRSGTVSSSDILLMLHELTTKGASVLSGTPGSTSPRFDVNGDGSFSLGDALMEIHFLQNGFTIPSASGLGLVPEPSSAVLAIYGAVALVAGHILRRRRRR